MSPCVHPATSTFLYLNPDEWQRVPTVSALSHGLVDTMTRRLAGMPKQVFVKTRQSKEFWLTEASSKPSHARMICLGWVLMNSKTSSCSRWLRPSSENFRSSGIVVASLQVTEIQAEQESDLLPQSPKRPLVRRLASEAHRLATAYPAKGKRFILDTPPPPPPVFPLD